MKDNRIELLAAIEVALERLYLDEAMPVKLASRVEDCLFDAKNTVKLSLEQEPTK